MKTRFLSNATGFKLAAKGEAADMMAQSGAYTRIVPVEKPAADSAPARPARKKKAKA